MMHIKVHWWLRLAILAGILLIGIQPMQPAQAQAGLVRWTKPINLSNTPTCSSQPAVVADKYGNVHVFWTEEIGGKRCSGAPTPGKAILYTRSNGTEWLAPVDIIVTSVIAARPKALIDSQGIMHLLYMGNDGIYASSAPSWAATSAKAWSAPQRILAFRYMGTAFDAVIAPDDSQHVLYSDWGNGLSPNDGNVYYTYSEDGGKIWSDALQISDIAFGQELATLPRLALDAAGGLHAVWGQITNPDSQQKAVYYRYLEKDAAAFKPARVVMSVGPEESWMMDIHVAVVGQEVNLMWTCGHNPYRCSQTSIDLGKTWSAPLRVFSELLSQAGYDDIAIDGDGKVYWVAQLREPSAMYYSVWEQRQWTDPPTPFVTSGPVTGGHASTLAVGLGNQLHLVMQDQARGEIYYTRGQTTSSAKPALPAPTPAPPPTPTLPPSETLAAPITEAAATPTVIDPSIQDLAPSNRPIEQWIVLLGVAPVLFIVGLLLLIRSGKNR